MQSQDIDVVLTTYKRPECLQKQLTAIKNQTLKPKHIYLYQDAVDTYYKIVLRAEILRQFDHVEIAEKNGGVWKRFEYAHKIVKSTYVCIFDDDTIPGRRWLENCFTQMQNQEGIYGTNGILLSDSDEYPISNRDIRVGWNNPNRDSVMVDFVGHSWFLKTQWLDYMLDDTEEIQERYKYVGEDMCLSYGCYLHNINTYVPPHPLDALELWGSIPSCAIRYGVTKVAISANSIHYKQMNEVLKELRGREWKTVYERNRDDYCQTIKMLEKNKMDKEESILDRLKKLWNNKKKIYLYGAGNYGKLFFEYLKRQGLQVEGFVVSDESKIKGKKYLNLSVFEVNKLIEKKEKCIVVLALNEFYHDEIRSYVKSEPYVQVYPPENDNAIYEELIEAIKKNIG